MQKKKRLSAEFWEKLIQKIECDKIPVTRVLSEIGISKTTYYRKKDALNNGGLKNENGLGRPLAYKPAAYQEKIKKIVKELYPFVSYRKIWQKLDAPKPSLATIYRLVKKLELNLPCEKEKERKISEFIKKTAPLLKGEPKTRKKGLS